MILKNKKENKKQIQNKNDNKIKFSVDNKMSCHNARESDYSFAIFLREKPIGLHVNRAISILFGFQNAGSQYC